MHRIRRRHGRVNGKFVASAVAAGLVLAAWSHTSPGASGAAVSATPPATTAASPAAATAITYARAQLGKPYMWGGTGPGAFDCSGLVMRAWEAAGVSIARVSGDQWDTRTARLQPQPR